MKIAHLAAAASAFVLAVAATAGVRSAVAAPQSGAPPVAPPSIQPPAPQTVQAAQAAERRKYYEVTKTFTAAGGGVSSDMVGCNSAFDFPVTGGCSAPQGSGARLVSSAAGNVGDPTLPFYWRCAYFNDSKAVQVEARVVCRRP